VKPRPLGGLDTLGAVEPIGKKNLLCYILHVSLTLKNTRLIDHNVANEERKSAAVLVVRAGRFMSISIGIEINSKYVVHIK